LRLVRRRTTKLNEKQTKTLLSLVEAAEARDKKFFDLCSNSRRWMKGDHWRSFRGKNRESARITINLMHAHARSLLPTLFFQDPYIECYPNDKIHQEESAVVWEGLLNHLNERNGYKRITKDVVFDAIIYPEAWKKWVVIKEADSEEVESGEENLTNLDGVSGGLSEENQAGPLENTSLGSIVGTRLSPEQVITDSSDRDPAKCRFIAVKYKRLLSEVKSDPRYKVPGDAVSAIAAPQKNLTASFPGGLHAKVNQLGKDEPTPVTADIDPEVTLYEVWVYQLVKTKLYRQVVTLLKEWPNLPIRQPEPWESFVGRYMQTYPFTRLVLNPIPDSKPMSELASFKSMQDAINWLSSRLVSMVENQKQFYNFYSTNAKNPEKARTQLDSGNIREFLDANDVGQPVIEAVEANSVPHDIYQLLQIMMGFVQQVTGFGMNRRGEAGIRTAKEAAIVEQGVQIKTTEKVDTISDYIRADMEILARIVRHVAPSSFVFYLRGESGPVKWQKFTMKDADWAPDIRIRPQSFAPAVDQERQQALMSALQAGAQLFQIYGPKIRLDVVYRRLLEELNIPNPSAIMGDTIPDEIFQMVEIVMMVLGQEAPVMPNHNHRLHRATLQDFLSSDAVSLLPPDAIDRLNQHDMQHQQFEEQNTEAAPNLSGMNPFSSGGMREPSGAGPEPQNGMAMQEEASAVL
jgi:hypothetical protein